MVTCYRRVRGMSTRRRRASACPEVAREPFASELSDLLEGARLLEDVRGASNSIEANRRFHPPQRLLVHFDDDSIATSNDEQRRSMNVRQFVSGQIGTTTSR